MKSRPLVIAAAAVVVVVAVAVAVTFAVVDRDSPDAARPDVAATGVPNFPARGPSAGDNALIRRAVEAWRWADGPKYLLWAGPRPGGAVVVLASGRRESPRVAIYDDRARAVVREAPHEQGFTPIRVDDTGWLLPVPGKPMTYRLLRQDPYSNEPAKVDDGLLEAAAPAFALSTRGGYLLRGDSATLVLPVGDLTEQAADEASGRRLVDAALNARAGDSVNMRFVWRGAVPGVGGDAMILGGGGTTNPWYSIGFGDGTALLFTGPAASASPSPGVSNCGPAPACLKARRVGLPMLLAGWLYRGPASPRVLVVVGAPEVVRTHVRAGTLTRDLPPGAAGLTAADLGVPAAPDDAQGGDAPAVVVYGELADGTAVPALTATA